MSTEAMKDLALRMAVQLSADARTAQRLLDMIELWPVREAALLERNRELEEENAKLRAAAVSGLQACLIMRKNRK